MVHNNDHIKDIKLDLNQINVENCYVIDVVHGNLEIVYILVVHTKIDINIRDKKENLVHIKVVLYYIGIKVIVDNKIFSVVLILAIKMVEQDVIMKIL